MKFKITHTCKIKGETVKQGEIVDLDEKYSKSLLAAGRGVPHEMVKGERTFKFGGKDKPIPIPKGSSRAKEIARLGGEEDELEMAAAAEK